MAADPKRPLNGFVTGTFPLYRQKVRELIEAHKQLEETPLLLGIWYDKDDPKDVRLLEVLANWPSGDPPGDMAAVSFNSTAEFPLVGDGVLYAVLCSADDLAAAIASSQTEIARVREAFNRGQAELIYLAPDCPQLGELLRALQA